LKCFAQAFLTTATSLASPFQLSSYHNGKALLTGYPTIKEKRKYIEKNKL
jgi:hypothetical protein